jgi:uncharacterized protein YecE (DUF72 family)
VSAKRTNRAWIGTSGWTYDFWREDFYAGIPRAQWLVHYARHFDAVEVNATFYHTLKPETFAHWREETPQRFRFAIKGTRYATHVKRLEVDAGVIDRARAPAAKLGPKLAVVVWQLPARLERDDARLARFFRRLARWKGPRHAIEFRHPSWFDAAVERALADAGIANVLSDAADWPMWDAVTADLAYARLHGHAATYVSAYGRRALAQWARRARQWLSEGREVHVYFDNTDAGHAVRDAAALRDLLGPEPVRTPRASRRNPRAAR